MDFIEMGIYGFYKSRLNFRGLVFKRGAEDFFYKFWSETGSGFGK